MRRGVMARFWAGRRVWLPALAVLGVLIATWLLLPREKAPFIYEYF